MPLAVVGSDAGTSVALMREHTKFASESRKFGEPNSRTDSQACQMLAPTMWMANNSSKWCWHGCIQTVKSSRLWFGQYIDEAQRLYVNWSGNLKSVCAFICPCVRLGVWMCVFVCIYVCACLRQHNFHCSWLQFYNLLATFKCNAKFKNLEISVLRTWRWCTTDTHSDAVASGKIMRTYLYFLTAALSSAPAVG